MIKNKRRLLPFRFSLRTLFIAIACVALLMALLRYRYLSQHYAANVLKNRGIELVFEPRATPQDTFSWLVFGPNDYDYVTGALSEGSNWRPSDVLLLRHFPPLSTLRITANDDVDTLLGSQNFDNLRVFVLNGGKVSDKCLRKIASYPMLTSVRFESVDLSDTDLSCFAESKNVSGISLSGATVSDRVVHSLRKWKTLERLGLYDTAVTDDGMSFMDSLHSLDHLYIDGGTITEGSLLYAGNLPCLQLVQLKNCPYLQKLSPLSKAPQLKLIVLESTGVTSQEASRFKSERPDCKIYILDKSTEEVLAEQP